MLASCTRHLLEEGWHVHAIARDQAKLDALRDGGVCSVSTYACDYRDFEQFERAIDHAPGPVDAVLCWIHDSGRAALGVLLDRFSGVDVLRVVGSGGGTPPERIGNERLVELGFIIEGGASRWLTHDEISDGVHDALVSGRTMSIVGTVEPGSMRP